ncbi:putative transcription factor GTE2-like protein [Tanacetum coccineum]
MEEKIKLMISYGGKINHRSHDNKLTYTGGDTKILTVDRSVINFTHLFSKLINLIELNNSSDVKVKYKLPGHDLDALVSVFDDDDVANMLYEYDLMRRGGGRLRLFVFFPVVTTPVTAKSVNPDFLFGFDKEYNNNMASFTDNNTVTVVENLLPVVENVTRGSYVYPAPIVYGAPNGGGGYLQAQQVVYKYVPVGVEQITNIPVMSGSQMCYDPTMKMSATSDWEVKVGGNGHGSQQLES